MQALSETRDVDFDRPAHITSRLTRQELSVAPAWDMVDLSFMLDLPLSTLKQVLADNPAPLFLMGRRKYILREDALEWLRELSIRTAHTPRRNKRKA